MKIKTTGKNLTSFIILERKIFLFIIIISQLLITTLYANNIKTSINFDPDFIQIGDNFSLIITLSSYQEKILIKDIPDLKNVIKTDLIKFESEKPVILKSNTFIYTGIIISKKYTLRIIYKMKALKTGKIDLPSFNLNVNGESIIIKSIPLIISEKIQKKAEVLNSFINIEKNKNKLYPGEVLKIKYYLYSIHNIFKYKIINLNIPDSLFVSYNNVENKIEQLFIEEHIYNKINVLNLEIIADKPGIYKIPEIKIQAKTKSAKGIKTVISEVNIASESIFFEVIPFPQSPPDKFTGLIGEYKFNYRYNILENKNNGFIKIDFKIIGRGNLNNLLLNNIIFSNSYFDIIGPNRETNEDYSEFIYFAIPKYSGKLYLPSIEFYYFNTSKNKFEKVYIPEEQVYIKKKVINKKDNNVGVFKLTEKSILKNTKFYKLNYKILKLFIISMIPLILIPFYLLINFTLIKIKIKSRQKIYYRSYYGLWLIFIDKIEKKFNIDFLNKSEEEFFKIIKNFFNPRDIEFLKKVKYNLNNLFNGKSSNINYKILKKFKKWLRKNIKV